MEGERKQGEVPAAPWGGSVEWPPFFHLEASCLTRCPQSWVNQNS